MDLRAHWEAWRDPVAVAARRRSPARVVLQSITLTLVAASALVLVTFAVFYLQGNRLVISPSIPMGWWTFYPIPTLRRGMTVAGCLPTEIVRTGRERGYLPSGPCPGGALAIAKVVVALPGDVVELHGATLLVNRRPVPCGARQPRDPSGRRLAGLPDGRYPLPRGSVWLCGSDPLSWDSRYYGPVPESAIFVAIRPVLVDGGGVAAYDALVRAAYR